MRLGNSSQFEQNIPNKAFQLSSNTSAHMPFENKLEELNDGDECIRLLLKV